MASQSRGKLQGGTLLHHKQQHSQLEEHFSAYFLSPIFMLARLLCSYFAASTKVCRCINQRVNFWILSMHARTLTHAFALWPSLMRKIKVVTSSKKKKKNTWPAESYQHADTITWNAIIGMSRPERAPHLQESFWYILYACSDLTRPQALSRRRAWYTLFVDAWEFLENAIVKQFGCWNEHVHTVHVWSTLTESKGFMQKRIYESVLLTGDHLLL